METQPYAAKKLDEMLAMTRRIFLYERAAFSVELEANSSKEILKNYEEICWQNGWIVDVKAHTNPDETSREVVEVCRKNSPSFRTILWAKK